MKRHLALIAGLSLAGCGNTPVHKLHAGGPTSTTSTSVVAEATDPTYLDWEALARITTTTQRASRSRITTSPPVAALLACIRKIESGGDYHAVSASGTYRGAYQFDQPTWQSVGGHGDPAAASPVAQDAAAARLLTRRGLQPWPTPARRCA